MPRRLVADLMHASVRVPFVSLSRPLNVRSLTEARALAAQPPGWAAIFVKAFAMVAKDEPVLRTLYALRCTVDDEIAQRTPARGDLIAGFACQFSLN